MAYRAGKFVVFRRLWEKNVYSQYKFIFIFPIKSSRVGWLNAEEISYYCFDGNKYINENRTYPSKTNLGSQKQAFPVGMQCYLFSQYIQQFDVHDGNYYYHYCYHNY